MEKVQKIWRDVLKHANDYSMFQEGGVQSKNKEEILYNDLQKEIEINYLKHFTNDLKNRQLKGSTRVLVESKEKHYGSKCKAMKRYVKDHQDISEDYSLSFYEAEYPVRYKMISSDMGYIDGPYRKCQVIACVDK
jgi:hypothetical protein